VTTSDGLEEVGNDFDVVSSNERRVLQPVKWLSRAERGEEADKSCNWDQLGIDPTACERYVCTYAHILCLNV
jgi:hypothetical protein